MPTSAKVILEETGFAGFSPTLSFVPKHLFSKRRWTKSATTNGISTLSRNYAGTSLRPHRNRSEVAGALEKRRALLRRRRFLQAQVLRGRDASVSQRPPAHGPRAQLRHRRRAGALYVDARLQRHAPYGLGRVRSSRRKRRDQERHTSPRMDHRPHRRNEAADESHGVFL